MIFRNNSRAVASPRRLDVVRSTLGALLGIALTGLLCRIWLDGDLAALPFLVAPMGASAVLLFVVPASPLAQPWSVLGGNILSALAATAVTWLIPDPVYAAGPAVAAAIAVMRMARCLHPPGGAVALTVAVGGPAIAAAGWTFAFVPVGLNTALLVAFAWAFNNTTRHRYPHQAGPAPVNTHATSDPPPQNRTGYTIADIDAVLARYDELLDVTREDLDALFRQVEARAYRRLHGVLSCERIMSRDVIVAHPGESPGEARDRLLRHGLSAMPVVDAERIVVGSVDHPKLFAGKGETVGEVMDTSPVLVSADTALDELLPLMSGGSFHHVVVVDRDARLLGMITQTDLLAAVWRGHIAEQVTTASLPGLQVQAAE